MSKIGRTPISFSSAKIEIDGNKVLISGSKAKFVHELPEYIKVKIEDNSIVLSADNQSKIARSQWGLHRALIANKIEGAEKGFEQAVKIVGLGYKVQLSGKKLIISLGYSHKINLDLPDGVTLNVDKTGQQLTFKSHDKVLLGNVCDELRRLRPPEPYKGTGVMRAEEVIRRKAGKTGV